MSIYQLIDIVVIAAWAVLYVHKLTRADQILSIIPRLGARLRIPDLLAYPLYKCGTCHAGWVAVGYAVFTGLTLDTAVRVIVLTAFLAFALEERLITRGWI